MKCRQYVCMFVTQQSAPVHRHCIHLVALTLVRLLHGKECEWNQSPIHVTARLLKHKQKVTPLNTLGEFSVDLYIQ